MLRKWPNESNRRVYPAPRLSAPFVTKPRPLSQELIDRYTAYMKEYNALFEKKQKLEEKADKLAKELDTAENTKVSSWSRRDTGAGLVKRLTAEFTGTKIQLLAAEKAFDSLMTLNAILVSVVVSHESCVKGYEDYIAWKEESDRNIIEAFMRTG